MSFTELDPRHALVFLPLDGQFRQDVGANLFVDGDMEAPDASAWTLLNVTAEKRTDTPHSGTRYLRVSRTGATAMAYQWCGSNGQTLHASGWARADGSSYPTLYAPPGTARITFPWWIAGWQYRESIWTQGVSTITGFYGGAVIGNYADYDDWTVYDYPQVVRSLALGGAPNYARMGDGHTSTSFPTQLARGLRFDGGDYTNLVWTAGGVLDTQTFTVCALVRPNIPVADGRIYEVGIAGQRYSLYYDLSDSKIVWWKDDVVDQTIASGYGSAYGQPFVVCASIANTGMNLWVDGRLMGSIAGDVRLPSFNAASVASLGRDVAGGNYYQGDIYQTAIYPFEMTQAQVLEWGRRAKQARTA